MACLAAARHRPSSEGWSGRRGSNPRPTAWKAVTLPLSYSRLRYRSLRSQLRRGQLRLPSNVRHCPARYARNFGAASSAFPQTSATAPLATLATSARPAPPSLKRPPLPRSLRSQLRRGQLRLPSNVRHCPARYARNFGAASSAFPQTSATAPLATLATSARPAPPSLKRPPLPRSLRSQLRRGQLRLPSNVRHCPARYARNFGAASSAFPQTSAIAPLATLATSAPQAALAQTSATAICPSNHFVRSAFDSACHELGPP